MWDKTRTPDAAPAAAQQSVSKAGDGAGALEDALSRTPAAVLPQTRGLMIGLKALEYGGATGDALIGVYMGWRYGDRASAVGGITRAFSGTLTAAAYKRFANIVEPGRNVDLAADIIANVVPQGINPNASGRCGSNRQ